MLSPNSTSNQFLTGLYSLHRHNITIVYNSHQLIATKWPEPCHENIPTFCYLPIPPALLVCFASGKHVKYAQSLSWLGSTPQLKENMTTQDT